MVRIIVVKGTIENPIEILGNDFACDRNIEVECNLD